jgi:hypothetical protein
MSILIKLSFLHEERKVAGGFNELGWLCNRNVSRFDFIAAQQGKVIDPSKFTYEKDFGTTLSQRT